jgi:hypothetical protein
VIIIGLMPLDGKILEQEKEHADGFSDLLGN